MHEVSRPFETPGARKIWVFRTRTPSRKEAGVEPWSVDPVRAAATRKQSRLARSALPDAQTSKTSLCWSHKVLRMDGVLPVRKTHSGRCMVSGCTYHRALIEMFGWFFLRAQTQRSDFHLISTPHRYTANFQTKCLVWFFLRAACAQTVNV